MYARYLAAQPGCAVGLPGIQPVSTQMGETVSVRVQESVRAVAEGILGEWVPAVTS